MEEITNYLNSLRRDFAQQELNEEVALADPFEQFAKWLEEAVNGQVFDPQAMVVSTVNPETLQPSARVVYMRGLNPTGLIFYTNYESQKATELLANPRASLNFHWGELERQVRLEGQVRKAEEAVSDQYFAERPRKSQVGAWASHQSRQLDSRQALEDRFSAIEAQYDGQSIPRPPHWGGFVFEPHLFEFWQGRPGRLHDRLQYTRQEQGWTVQRLNP